ncbi:hypothetical protein FRC04_007542 [Tulasnella sp. 424]|nr:hypothetical protein FRC04_007542 [Tulasnella sp. 424]
MTSSNRQHIRYSPITEADNIFSFAPPEDVQSRNGAYPSYVPSTQLSEMTELSGGPPSLSSHSRNLTTGPTATSISFPITPNSDGPPSPLSPSHGSMMEQRFNSIQSRIAPTPSTGGSGGMMFTFVPPPEALASSRPATSSQLSSIAESTTPNSFHRDTMDLEDGLPEVGPSNSSIGKASK